LLPVSSLCSAEIISVELAPIHISYTTASGDNSNDDSVRVYEAIHKVVLKNNEELKKKTLSKYTEWPKK